MDTYKFVYMVMMHFSRCGTCRRVLEYLDKHSTDHHVVHYVTHPPSREEWSNICRKLKMHPRDLLRKDSPIVRMRWGDRNWSDEEWLGVLVRYPQLARRPIVYGDDWALIATDPKDLEPYLVNV